MNLGLLKLSWNQLTQELQVENSLSEKIFIDLINTYSKPNRYYHNLEHIQNILNIIEPVKKIANNFQVIQLAAWFHDYIYNPQAKDNEFQSALYAVDTLNQLKISAEIIEVVKQIIISTQKHQPAVNNLDNNLDILIFLDADLSILGTSLDNYLKYAQAIRQEYNWLSDREYQKGRKQVLINFLSRERIYYTDYFYHKLEIPARNNLQAELFN